MTIHCSQSDLAIPNESVLSWLDALLKQGGPSLGDYKGLDQLFIRWASEPSAILVLRKRLGAALGLETMQGFALQKPHGYAGDFEIIDRIYAGYVVEDTQLSRWDVYWQQHAAAKAVRNRKSYFHGLLEEVESRNSQAKVLKVAVGPGRSMFEYLESGRGKELTFDCVDVCPKSITYASRLNADYAEQMTFHQRNALRFSSGQLHDLVWSAGLFDYLNDRMATFLLQRLWAQTAPGGELVVGNFSLSNPSQHYMAFFGWDLIHRSESDLIRLATEAGIPEVKLNIGKEPESVNLFLHARN